MAPGTDVLEPWCWTLQCVLFAGQGHIPVSGHDGAFSPFLVQPPALPHKATPQGCCRRKTAQFGYNNTGLSLIEALPWAVTPGVLPADMFSCRSFPCWDLSWSQVSLDTSCHGLSRTPQRILLLSQELLEFSERAKKTTVRLSTYLTLAVKLCGGPKGHV